MIGSCGLPEGWRDVPTMEQAILLTVLGARPSERQMELFLGSHIVDECVTRGWVEMARSPAGLVRTNGGMVALARYDHHEHKKREAK